MIGHPATLLPLRQIVPPYSLNAYAAAALPAAMADRDYCDWYVAQAQKSRLLLTDACERLGLRTWPSAANFMLVHAARAPRRLSARWPSAAFLSAIARAIPDARGVSG